LPPNLHTYPQLSNAILIGSIPGDIGPRQSVQQKLTCCINFRTVQDVDLLTSVICITITLRKTYTNKLLPDLNTISVSHDQSEVGRSSYVESLTSAHHMALPTIVEEEIVMVWCVSSGLHIVRCREQLCAQRVMPFASTADGPQFVNAYMDDTTWTLQATSEGCAGVSSFKGIVLDADRTQITTYLIQAGELGGLINMMSRAKMRGQVIHWSRKFRWIENLLTTITHLHNRGIVLGRIHIGNIGTDNDDCAIIGRYHPVYHQWKNTCGFLPPELRQINQESQLVDSINLTMSSDIFQLEMLIWVLAMNISSPYEILLRRKGLAAGPCTPWS
jgi:hypothetical protein